MRPRDVTRQSTCYRRRDRVARETLRFVCGKESAGWKIIATRLGVLFEIRKQGERLGNSRNAKIFSLEWVLELWN